MKISKTVKTEYKVDLINGDVTGMALSDTLLALENAGVKIGDFKVVAVYPKSFVLSNTSKTFYDRSTLNRMEE